jgi:hypothetical protein
MDWLQEQLESASREVESWPEWKRRALRGQVDAPCECGRCIVRRIEAETGREISAGRRALQAHASETGETERS